MEDKFDSIYLDEKSYWMHVPGQTEQSGAKQSCLADPTFEVGKTVGKAVGKTIGMTVAKAVRKAVRMTVGKA